ncbi:MAG: DsrE family protein [Bacteroidota bacterium]|jgi:uncharacterized protein involved in oxidation of intracellular sulfur
MKKTFVLVGLFVCIITVGAQAQTKSVQTSNSPTSIGMVLYSNDTEALWNAFRLANFSLKQGDTVNVFLLGKGVDLDALAATAENLKEQVESFQSSGGVILACGTCLQSRNNANPKLCSVSTMGELYDMIRKSSLVLTF